MSDWNSSGAEGDDRDKKSPTAFHRQVSTSLPISAQLPIHLYHPHRLTSQENAHFHLDVASDEIGVLRDGDAQKILPYEADDSPFPEVRAVVPPVDDVTLPVNTLRMWTIGVIFTIVGVSLLV